MTATRTSGAVDWLSVKQFGAKGDRTADDTAAFQNAFATVHAMTSPIDVRPRVFVPSGKYLVHELDWGGSVEMFGNGPQHSQIAYNGAGGAGSYTMRITGTDAFGGSGLAGLRIAGNPIRNSTDEIAENALQVNVTSADGSGVDWGSKFEWLQVGYCFGDAITFSNTIVNLHMKRMRIDAPGGFAFAFNAGGAGERPITITDCTWGSDPESNFKNTGLIVAAADGYYDGVHWGKGFLYIDNSSDSYFHIADARLESSRLTTFDGRRQIIYVRSGCPNVMCYNVSGSYNKAFPGVFFRDAGGDANFFADGRSYMWHAKVFETARDTSTKWDIGVSGHHAQGSISCWGSGSTSFEPGDASNGHYINGSQLEFRDAMPDNTIDRDYKAGDIIFNKTAGVGDPVGWIVTAPPVGWGNPATPTLSQDVSTIAGSNVITVNNSLDTWRFVVGAAITIIGADTAGGDLDTVITDINPDTGEVTVADTIVVGT